MEFSHSADLGRTTFVHPQSQLSDIQIMGTEVRHLTSGVIPEEAKQIMHAFFVVRSIGCRAEPEIIVQGRRWIGIRDGRRSKVNLWNPDANFLHFSDGPIAK